ncbi:ThuA domain-containing protein [Luteimonas sp. BDR2-5]|uniref:ThuA domain-containing protein n=1 Tax=Proluteimonas luteida TaxID=2878685 RepID=UPI001E3B55E3|nr:ThuA domain-containing protein [Luteimonas sp. BDR2-5]MCD9028252.1 ThuA domain-containing protein [Luteimonas sp. BDR2-5]
MHLVRRCLAPWLLAATVACAGDGDRAPAVPTASPDASAAAPRILVFSRTAGFRHDSIPVAVETLRAIGADAGFAVDASEDATRFDDAVLARYRAVVFANVTGEVLGAAQQAAFERYVATGGGFVGVHAAADSGYAWPWYGELVGAWFARHPEGLQPVRVVFEVGPGPSGTRAWAVTDEIYDYRRNPRPDVRVVASIDPASHPRGGMGDDHPIAWCHRNAGGRAWYTGLGHDPALYDDPVFRAHLLRGLRYAAGQADDC